MKPTRRRISTARGSFVTLGAENRQSRTISMAQNKTKPTDASVDDYIA